MDASTLAQKTTAQWANMSRQQRLKVKTMLGDNVENVADVMKAIKSLENGDERLKDIAFIVGNSTSPVKRDDLLAYYVEHESRFTPSQKSIMATVVDASFSGEGNVDQIITHGIVHNKDLRCLPRLERTMAQCVAVYQPPPQTFSPMQLYGGPNGPYGNVFNK